MDLQENVSLKGKTTMRIGGEARYYADLASLSDAEEAVALAEEKNLPLIVLGGGSNMIFADGVIEAMVVRVANESVEDSEDPKEKRIHVGAGKNLPQLINELAEQKLDLSPLTGILGSVGGALFGNSGQGPKGIWIDTYVESVTAYIDGTWQTLSKKECNYRYRESGLKDLWKERNKEGKVGPLIWSCVLSIPQKSKEEIEEEIARLLQQRIDTQPHVKTAGSCFKAVGGTPAWKLIDAAGLRGHQIGGVSISQKHTNFLINEGNATYNDAVQMVKTARDSVSEPLEVEMRFVKEDGGLEF